MSASSSSDEDDGFLRFNAKAIAEALQQRDAAEQALAAGGASASSAKSERERMIHDTYIALCYDDPRVESDLACHYLATALLDPQSQYALSGPLVEGIRQLCGKQQQQQQTSGTATTPSSSATEESENLTSNAATSASPKGAATLAWAIGARIPLLCCQASNLSDVHAFLGSYRPPPPSNPLATGEDDGKNSKLSQALNSKQQLGEEADRLAAMLSQQPSQQESKTSSHEADRSPPNENDNLDPLEQEVWAAESDPSDFEFESGFSYEEQLADVENTFAEWTIDRTDPIKLSKPPTTTVTTWKQVRHAVMDLASQLNYRQVASLWNHENPTASQAARGGGLTGSRGPSDILTQFTMTLLVPPSSTYATTNSRPSIFDSPDDEEDVLQPQRQLQAMAWFPLWVMRDAAANNASNLSYFSQYLTLLQNLIAVDAAAGQPSTTATKEAASVAPATYVGLASLSALCQQFVTEAESSTATGGASNNHRVERFRELRRSVWETCDDLSHVMEQEEKIRKAEGAREGNPSSSSSKTSSSANDNYWIVWTLLPLFEILTNQRLQTGTTIVAKAESVAQRHHNQQHASQQWSAGLLQSGLFRHWLLRCQDLKEEKTEASALLWQYVRRSLLYMIAQSMPATSALGKYAWRFPNFVALVEIGESYCRSDDEDLAAASAVEVDGILWNLLAMELAGAVASSAPTIQWKSSAKNKPSNTLKPLPSRLECQKVSWAGFRKLCQSVVRVLELACQEENKKENLETKDAGANEKEPAPLEKSSDQDKSKLKHQAVLQSFQRLVNCLAACPLLARLFVNNLEPKAEDGIDFGDGTISKCLDAVQKALTQYKPPSPDYSKGSAPKAKDEDGEGDAAELDTTKAAKEQLHDASLQEEIHVVRKVLKVLRSILATKTSPSLSSAASLVPQDLTSSSKTD